MAGSLAKAAAAETAAIARGDAPVTDQEVAARLLICAGCDRYIVASKRCSDCGCYVKFKTKLRSEHCPQGKW